MKIREFAEKVLEESDKPLSYRQIWETGVELGYDKELETKSKDKQWINVSSTIRQDINNRPDTPFRVVSNDSILLYGLKTKKYTSKVVADVEKDEKKKDEQSENNTSYNECDLHPALVTFLNGDRHFNCYTKTIVQQEGKKAPKGIDKWTYPDLIGVYFPFRGYDDVGDYDDCTVNAMRALEINAYRVFSFEMKKALTQKSLREYFFQTVSNSSWANEGYLVAAEIEFDDELLMQEMSLLNKSFGIGIIKLDYQDPMMSEIVFPAKPRDIIDIDMLNKLIRRSASVAKLFDYVTRTSGAKRVSLEPEIFDEIMDVDTYQEKYKKNGNTPSGMVERKK